MDLKSSGMYVFALVLLLCNCCRGNRGNIKESAVDAAGSVGNVYNRLERVVSGKIFIITAAVTEDTVDGITAIIQNVLQLDGHTFIKVAGGPITKIYEGIEIGPMIANTQEHSTVDIIDELYEVLYLSAPKIHMYVITDHGPAETEGVYMLMHLLKETQSQLDVIAIAHKEDQGSRHVRAVDFYQLIAQQSGGSVIHTTKNNIGTVVDILKQSLKAHQVNILQFAFDPHNGPGKNLLKVPADDTMAQLTLQIHTQTAPPVVIPSNPAGTPLDMSAGTGNSRKQLGNTLLVFEFNLTKPSYYGEWTFMKLDKQIWNVQVTGESPVDFTYEFLEPGPGGFGMYPIKGRPISGSKYKLVVTVPEYAKEKSVTTALFLDNKNAPMPPTPLTLTNQGGRRGKDIFYAENVVVPKDDFKIAIEGVDKTSHKFRRLDTILVTPISVRLIMPSFAGVKLYKNEVLNLTFTVVNEASKEQDLDARIEDDKHFAKTPTTLSYTIKAGRNKTGQFSIQGGNVVGETVTVTITAKPYIPGQVTSGQYEIRRFTVEERKKKPEDKINPTCNITSVTGTCKIGSDLCACSKHYWSMDVNVGDEGFGIREIFPTGAGSNTSFTHDNFTIGHNMSMGAIKASIGGDCCHQSATIQVVDKAGNTAQCTPNITQNFQPPDPNLCNKTAPLNITMPCAKTEKTGKCDFGKNPCDCHTKGWHIKVTFGTVGWNLHQAFTVGAGNNASITQTGQVVELDSDCCHQQITVNGLDLAGNVGQCNVSLSSFVTPKPTDCTTTTSTTQATTTPKQTTTPTKTKSSAASGVTSAIGSSNSLAPGVTKAANAAAASGKGGSGAVTSAASGKGGTGAVTSAASGKGGTGAVTSAASGKGGTGAVTSNSGKGAIGVSSSGTAGGSGSQAGTKSSGGPNTGLSGSQKPGSQSSTAAPSASSKDESKDSGISVSSVAAGMSVGAVIGIAAICAMGLIFRQALVKSSKSVDPKRRRTSSESENEPYRRKNDQAWM